MLRISWGGGQQIDQLLLGDGDTPRDDHTFSSSLERVREPCLAPLRLTRHKQTLLQSRPSDLAAGS